MTELTEIKRKVDATHDAVLRLDEKFNGGPGTWHVCVTHDEHISRLYKKQAWITRYILMAMGAGGVILFLVEHQNMLKLLSK